MTQYYIRNLREEILDDNGLSSTEKLFMGLVESFPDDGLKIKNRDLCRILSVSDKYIGEFVGKLESRGYIRIDKRQSPERRFYSQKFLEVEQNQLPDLSVSSTGQLPDLSVSNTGQLPDLSGTTPRFIGSHIRNINKQNVNTPALFEKFWKAYPRRASKQQALKAFLKLKPTDELLNRMITAIDRQKLSPQWVKDGGVFIPYPATWLNQHRWEDEPPLDIAESESTYKPREIDEKEADKIFLELGIEL